MNRFVLVQILIFVALTALFITPAKDVNLVVHMAMLVVAVLAGIVWRDQ